MDVAAPVSVQRSYAAVAANGGESVMEGRVLGASASVNAHVATSSSSERLAFDPEKKFNVVVYGISECPNGTSRSERLNQDLSDVVSVLSKVSSSIEPQAIKDCFRLGKFNPQRSKPRPILVKFIRIADVHCILSNRRLPSSSIFIKPDMRGKAQRIHAAEGEVETDAVRHSQECNQNTGLPSVC